MLCCKCLMSCCDLLYRYFTRTRQRIYPHGWCRTFQTSLTDPEDGRGTACGGCKACITISSCSCIQWRMEALVLVVFQHEGKRLLPCLHVVFLLVWCCLPIGWLVGHNGGHMRRSAWISDTDGLLFSSVFACKSVTLAVCERFSRCIIRSPKISVFLPWSLSYSWFSQLRQLPYFLIALVLSQ